MTDPIADMLTRIRNAYLARIDSLTVPYSRIKEKIVNILNSEGYIDSFNISGNKTKKIIELNLKYKKDLPAIDGIERVSKPGRRIYVSAYRIPNVLGGYGTTIISTNQGIMTGKEAKNKKVGGELICKIW
jgi:small subunit ribosomal protein S8